MKKISLVFATVALIFISHSSLIAQTFEWARKSGTNVIATGGAVATDEKGNSYVAGSFFGLITFGTFKFLGLGRDAYLVKYDHDGNVLWAKQMGGRADDFGNAVALDKEGNCYLAGSFAFTMHIGTDSLTARSQHDMFIAKYNAKGDLLWCKSAGGYYEDHAMAVSVDNSGNSYVAGYFRDTIRFGAEQILAGKGISSYNIFLAKYDTKGNFVWAKSLGSSSYATQNDGLAIASDANGMIYITGFYQNEANFDKKQFTNRGTFSLFVAKYSSAGKMIWAKSAGGDGASVVGKGLAIDKKGNCYVSGTLTSRATFDSITVTSKNFGSPDIFLAKYNTDGNIIWVRNTSGFGQKYPYAVKVDGEGNPYIIGTFQDTAIFGNSTLSGKGADHIFLVKYDSKGETQWAKQVGRHGAVLGKDLSFDKQENIYVTGNFSDTIELGKARLIALPNTQDVFFAKLSSHALLKEKKLADPPLPDFTFISCSLDTKSKIATVKFSIPKPMSVLLDVYDMVGTITESFMEGQRDAGVYEEKLELKTFSEGDYYCRLQAGRDKQSKKIELK